jgi:hypothetical protein
MNAITTTKPPRATQDPAGANCCGEPSCGCGLRNNYFVGKRLTPDSFQVEQDYLIGRRRLLNRALYGWGVVCGFSVAAAPPSPGQVGASGRVMVGAGLALDRFGRELVQEGAICLAFNDIILIDENGALIPRSRRCDATEHRDKGYEEQDWLLAIHYAEQPLGAYSVQDSCSCERREWEHVCETVRYSLRRVPRADCCLQPECELCCGCGRGPCCDEQAPGAKAEAHHRKEGEGSRNPVLRGGCNCLCKHLAGLDPGDGCGPLCEIEDACGRIRVDLCNEVAIACVRLRRNDCDRLVFDECVEACGPRRLVKRNDLLFDLIRGCDLTRITEVSWAHWDRGEADFDTFAKFFSGPETNEGTVTKFAVRFSRPVRAATVKADCFAMTAMFHEKEGGWWEPLRVPIVNVHTDESDGHITRAALVVRTRWAKDAILGSETRFDSAYGARVEIEIRGDFILDCNGQAVDANAIGLSAAPTGNGTPGGTHLSTFRVRKRDVPAEVTSY